ncbi:MAG: hypothetical protein FJW40_05790 [Acidobacteria bacterium]|nr:hypothetical protein [Acidobacteriota bacterium]
MPYSFTAPVMCTVGVRDAANSQSPAAVFYRNVLGFEILMNEGAVEAIHGPVRLRFEAVEPAMVFLEVQGLEALRRALEDGGAHPGPVARVNWIKYRLFGLTDPEGNQLWFGETFAEPDAPCPAPMLQQTLPELPCGDVAAAVDYYRDVLGFRINHQQDDLGVMDRDLITVLLVPRSPANPGPAGFEVYIENADQLHAELTASGARVLGVPVSRAWGLRDFQVLDRDGNRITFAQRFE